ncbi:tripartite motif-containing protein 30A-like [Clytia hemisphaerica]|uniref:RING-type domain-containing protein n=1 Tax=Clytia hemisphaerica TaxID=252671 RepID=A0A7M5WHX8_9CNID|eukprot:TCONS_00051386-protein
MASNKQNIIQEEEMASQACAVQTDHSKCSICLMPLVNQGSSNKCHQCMAKIDSVPNGFPFETVGPERKEFECPICLCIIKNATELPCEHLMCKECLEHYEKEQNERAKRVGLDEAEFLCSICQTEYKIADKNAVRSTDRMIQTTLQVKCLQKKCQWVGCIMDYEVHKINRCNFELIRCSYYDLGCLTNILKGDVQKHNQTNRFIHHSLLLTAVSAFSEERKGYRQKIESQDLKIQSLQDENNERFQALERRMDAQSNLVDGVVKKMQALEKENVDLVEKVKQQDKTIEEMYKEVIRKKVEAEKNILEVQQQQNHRNNQALFRLSENDKNDKLRKKIYCSVAGCDQNVRSINDNQCEHHYNFNQQKQVEKKIEKEMCWNCNNNFADDNALGTCTVCVATQDNLIKEAQQVDLFSLPDLPRVQQPPPQAERRKRADRWQSHYSK